jgi:hypothetical protein
VNFEYISSLKLNNCQTFLNPISNICVRKLERAWPWSTWYIHILICFLIYILMSNYFEKMLIIFKYVMSCFLYHPWVQKVTKRCPRYSCMSWYNYHHKRSYEDYMLHYMFSLCYYILYLNQREQHLVTFCTTWWM